jgi:heat shock protein HslJ
MCLDDADDPFTELMAREAMYLRLLAEVTSYGVEGEELTLSGPDFELVYRRGTAP